MMSPRGTNKTFLRLLGLSTIIKLETLHIFGNRDTPIRKRVWLFRQADLTGVMYRLFLHTLFRLSKQIQLNKNETYYQGFVVDCCS
ncbi:MAG TPA: hypothetical protein DE036_00860 [Actinobacteria bacterium]|nr:hypothetical protein [Actinomycetota bacterium]